MESEGLDVSVKKSIDEFFGFEDDSFECKEATEYIDELKKTSLVNTKPVVVSDPGPSTSSAKKPKKKTKMEGRFSQNQTPKVIIREEGKRCCRRPSYLDEYY